MLLAGPGLSRIIPWHGLMELPARVYTAAWAHTDNSSLTLVDSTAWEPAFYDSMWQSKLVTCVLGSRQTSGHSVALE